MDGYHDLAEPVNRFDQLGPNASTCMRTDRLESGPVVELMTFSDLRMSYGSCVSMFVSDEGQKIHVTLKLGTYQISDARIELDYSMQYLNTYMRTSNPSGVPGATQDELSPEKVEEALWHHDRAAGTIRIDGKVYQKADKIFEMLLNQESSDWTDRFMKMFILCTMAAHTRIEGFGGAGMLQYLGKESTCFKGLLFGKMLFSMEGLTTITTRFNYINHCDIAGMILNGEIVNRSDMSGTGVMDGILNFTAEGISQTWQGCVDYSGIHISEMLPDAGEYLLTVSDSTYFTNHNYGNPGCFDLTDILDPDRINQ